ncbi:hypothetical protein MMC12_003179 [Toensbergia leucococca]|nr:hypothetical protein [Toensbergia leucococca]
MASLLYNPTRIFSSPGDNGHLIYVFQSATASVQTSQLLSLNASKTLDAASLPYTTVSSSLPFLGEGQNESYTPMIDGGGRLYAYAGNCRNGAQGAMLWSYAPTNGTSGLQGTWVEAPLSSDRVSDSSDLNGANYLAAGIAFSSTADTSPEMFVFGGMCPDTASSVIGDWIQSANYSNVMLTIQQRQSSSSSSSSLPTTYDVGNSSSKGPPVSEAGFSITPLDPTFSNSSDGTKSQQQNFVLLGGHTQDAFINMSQVALFSLPEQSWSFLPVASPSETVKTDLTARDAPMVDPRSGHTAVLTSDGKRVVVFGGWVGNLSTSATPQLAVLEVGEAYGGNGDWQWTIPPQSGLTPETGLYGHGVTMLPGDVMMVIGGYSIPASDSARVKRSDLLMNNKSYFFNTTSNSWISNYTHPADLLGDVPLPDSSPDDMTPVEKAGLGAGLTLGFAAILGAIIVYFWYNRRLRRRREVRNNELRDLSLGTQRFHPSTLDHGDIGEAEHHPIAKDAYPWAPAVGNTANLAERSVWVEDGGSNAERTGLLVEIPSPTRGLRRSLYSRGHQSAPRYDDGRRSRGSGHIHSIDERDEYEEEVNESARAAEPEMAQRTDGVILLSGPTLDPFSDPAHLISVSRTPSPQSPARERELEVRNWVSDWSAADAILRHQAGRISPEKTDRTSSTLSEQSTRSTLSAHSIQKSAGTLSRSISQRSARLFNPTLPGSASHARNISPTFDFPGGRRTRPDYDANYPRSQSLTLFSRPQRTDTSDIFATAATSFAQLQSQGEALLGGNSNHRDTSPMRTNSRARGWMGSMRRAFTGGDRGTYTSPENGVRSSSSSPTKNHHTDSGIPRRAASAGAMLWQKRQGAKDWDVEGGGMEGDYRDSGLQAGDDEEWDVESAVERRVVQVMFTVPKEKLRVVNRGPDGDGESVLSFECEGAAKRDEEKGKGKNKMIQDQR